MIEPARILALVDDSAHAGGVLALAAGAAARFDAAVCALYAVNPFAGTYLTPEISATVVEIAREQYEAGCQRTADLVAEVSAASGRPIELIDPESNPALDVIARCRHADLVVLGQRDPEEGARTRQNISTRLLMMAGRPLLFMPYAADVTECGRRAVVAWTDSRESTRALHDALPWLLKAESVEVVSFRPNDADVGDSLDAVLRLLDAHGVAATASQHASPTQSITERIISPSSVDASVGEMLLSLVADRGADLLVMGGYGHSRAVEYVLGGVTRTVLQSMTVPVLMSH